MPDSPTVDEWRAPVILQVKSAAGAAVGVVIAAVFFPVWIAVPVAVILGAWGLSTCARRTTVSLDAGMGRLVIRMGLLTRRVNSADITVVQLDRAKVTIGKADGTAISVYAWRKSRLDGWLKIPVVASDMAHAISRAAARATQTGGEAAVVTPRSGRSLSVLALAGAGVAEIAATFAVRLDWGSPVMTGIAIVLALGFGCTGCFSVVLALWTYLAGRSARPA
jgi:hypothetical protein